MKEKYTLNDFNYELDESRIALFPAKPRDTSKLMVVDCGSQEIIHDKFINLHKYIPEKTILVFNNTKVLCAKIETFRLKDKKQFTLLFLSHQKTSQRWTVLTYPLKKLKKGDILLTKKNKIPLKFEQRINDEAIISIQKKINISEFFEKEGKMPLPPYIKRESVKKDKITYQTIFAEKEGSAAAPTAGLHFTKRVLKKLEQKGVEKTFITLHIGRGTFAPVREMEIEKHSIHKEWIEINKKTSSILTKYKKQNKNICAVGTTALRAIETCYNRKTKEFTPYSGETGLFIYPPKTVESCNLLLTNFHLPKSTLLMLVCAFGGYDFIMHAYKTALKNNYRFFSYGDAMLIIKEKN